MSSAARSWPPSSSSRPPGTGPSSASTTSAPSSAAAIAALQPGGAAADHEHVGVATAVLGAPLALVLVRAQPPEPGGVAEHLLVQRPQAPRPDEGLVVEAERRERAAEQVGGAHDVELEPRLRVHVLDAHPAPQRLGARAHARAPVDGHQVGPRAHGGAAEQAAPPVVLERARERPPAGRVQRGADRVPREALHRLAVEAEVEHRGAVDQLARLRSEAGHALRRRVGGQRGHQHLVRARVTVGDEPAAAARTVEPPLALHARDVAAEVVVLVELAPARPLFRACRCLAAEGEVGHLAHAAVRAGQQEGHACAGS